MSYLPLAGLVALALAVLPSASSSSDLGLRKRAHGDGSPNVLVLVADDLSERDLDRIDTPALDALAARGLRFRRAYANPTCSPSRWSLHFGQYHTKDAGPVCDGFKPKAAPSPEQASLPRSFAARGYDTALFGKWHLGSHAGAKEDGWETTPSLYGYATWRAGIPVNVNTCGGRTYRNWLRVDDGVARMSEEYIPDAIRSEFLAWLERREEDDRPWFAMVAFQLPHAPIHEAPSVDPPDPSSQAPSDPPQARTKRETWDSQVRYLDAVVAAMLEPLELSETLVLFVADNGSPRGSAAPDQDPHKKKMTTYEDGIRVPMIWAGPNLPEGQETEALAHLADVLPTLADRIELPLADEALDGVSLQPVLEDPKGSVRDYVWCGLGPNKTALMGDFAVVTATHKLRRVGGKEYLFDLDSDPHESTDMSGWQQHAELRATLATLLDQHLTEEHRPQLRPARHKRRGR